MMSIKTNLNYLQTNDHMLWQSRRHKLFHIMVYKFVNQRWQKTKYRMHMHRRKHTNVIEISRSLLLKNESKLPTRSIEYWSFTLHKEIQNKIRVLYLFWWFTFHKFLLIKTKLYFIYLWNIQLCLNFQIKTFACNQTSETLERDSIDSSRSYWVNNLKVRWL